MKLVNTKFSLVPGSPVYMTTGDGLEQFLAKVKQKSLVFFHPPWRLTTLYAFRLARKVKAMKRFGVQVVICCNEKRDITLLRVLGMRAHLLNQNMHLPESVFKPNDIDQIKFDAIYTAQAKPFKRLWLAKEIKQLYVLTYSCPQSSVAENDLHAYEPRIGHCEFNKRIIENENEICSLITRSACGLALSKKEGAMWAVMEYLMCGRPVVTTKNVGGRNHYLDNEIAIWAKSDPADIARAVYEYKNKKLTTSFVRGHVLKKVVADRHRFLEIVNLYAAKSGFEDTKYDYIWGGPIGIYDRAEPILFE